MTYDAVAPDGKTLLAPDAAADDEAAADGWSRHVDPERRADYFYRHQTNETTWSLPKRFPAPPDRSERPTLVALDITGGPFATTPAAQRVVPVRFGTDAAVAAARICQGYGILNWHCVDALTEKIDAGNVPSNTTAPPRPPPPPPIVVAEAPAEDAEVVPAAAAVSGAGPAATPVQRLRALKEAHEEGLVSDSEMRAKRDAILAEM